MNREEFYNEVNEYIQQLQDDFSKYQDIVMNTLNCFHEVCVKHNIKYQVAFGSLLGIYRDQGQIPWDYDVDVLVKYEDRSRLVEKLIQELSSKYIIDCVETDERCESYKLRITPKGFDPMVLHVDVFFLVPVVSNRFIQNYLEKKYIFLSKVRRYKTGKEIHYGSKSRFIKIDNVFHRILYTPISMKMLDHLYYKTVEKSMEGNNNEYILADRWARYRRFPSELIDKIEIVCIGESELMVPRDVTSMLKLCYGDDLGYLSIETRFNEWYSSCCHLNKFGRRKEK